LVYDGAERLVHFMRDRRGHLSEHGHARDMGERGLGDLQRLLRSLGRSHVHQRTDELLLARFIALTTRSNVNVFDLSIGHLQTVFIVEVQLASHRAVKLPLYVSAIVGMHALQEQTELSARTVSSNPMIR
jgi:hypothetical protein